MATDEPPYLTIGTDVSAKYKGAFCEAKIKKANRVVKCKVNFKNNLGTFMVTDDQIKGPLRVGAEVEARHPEKGQFLEAVINKLQDYSQYTVVFDDGDETTLRRTSLCLKSGRHFAESPTLDQFPLTNPEHFSSPVIGTSKFKRKRRSTMNSSLDLESSDEESVPRKVKAMRDKEHNPDLGRVVCVDFGDRRKKENWYPGLIMPLPQQSNIRILKEEHLVRSFKDGKYYQVPKRDTRDFNRESIQKVDNNALRSAVEKAVNYLEKDELPPHWEKALFAGLDVPSADEDSRDSDSDTSDDEPSEEKDRFVAQLYKFMDERGTPINKAPTVSNRDLNLYKLFKIMHKLGGYNKVTNKNKWKAVYLKMGLPASNPNGPNQIKFAYKRFLQSFEDFYRKLGCTMVSNSRSTRGRHRSDRNFIVTRTRDRDSPKGRKNSKEPKEKAPVEKKGEEKPKASAPEKKEAKPEEAPKAEEKLPKTPEKKRSEKPRPPEEEKKGKKEEKPRLVRSQSLTKEKKDSPKGKDKEVAEKARTREDARKEKNESPEKKGTRSTSKVEPQRKEEQAKKEVKPSPKEKDTRKEEKQQPEERASKGPKKEPPPRKPAKEKKPEEKAAKEKREVPPRDKKEDKSAVAAREKVESPRDPPPKEEKPKPKKEEPRRTEERSPKRKLERLTKEKKEARSRSEEKPSPGLPETPKRHPSEEVKEERPPKVEVEVKKEEKARPKLRERKEDAPPSEEEGGPESAEEADEGKDVSSQDESEKKTPPGRLRGDDGEEPPNKGKRRALKLDDKDEKESLCGMSDSDDGSFTTDCSEKLDAGREVEIGDRVKVKYGRGRLQKVYEAKVLKVEPDGAEKRYYVHYAGWNTRYDEWVRKNYIVANVSGKQKDNAKSSSPISLKKVDRGRPPGVLANTRPDRKNSTGSLRATRSEKKGSQAVTPPSCRGAEQSKRRPRKKSVTATDVSQEEEESETDGMSDDEAPPFKEELFSDDEEKEKLEEAKRGDITELEKAICVEESEDGLKAVVESPPAAPLQPELGNATIKVEDPPSPEEKELIDIKPVPVEMERDVPPSPDSTKPPNEVKEAVPDLSMTSSTSPSVSACSVNLGRFVPSQEEAENKSALSFAGLIKKSPFEKPDSSPKLDSPFLSLMESDPPVRDFECSKSGPAVISPFKSSPVFDEDLNSPQNSASSKEKFDSKSISTLFDSILKQPEQQDSCDVSKSSQPDKDSEKGGPPSSENSKTPDHLRSSESPPPKLEDDSGDFKPKDHFDILHGSATSFCPAEPPKRSDSKDDIFSFTFSPHNASKDTLVSDQPYGNAPSEDSSLYRKPSETVDVSKMIPGILERLKKDVVADVSDSPPPPKEELNFDFLRGSSQGVSKSLSRSDSSNSLRICESDTNDSNLESKDSPVDVSLDAAAHQEKPKPFVVVPDHRPDVRTSTVDSPAPPPPQKEEESSGGDIQVVIDPAPDLDPPLPVVDRQEDEVPDGKKDPLPVEESSAPEEEEVRPELCPVVESALPSLDDLSTAAALSSELPPVDPVASALNDHRIVGEVKVELVAEEDKEEEKPSPSSPLGQSSVIKFTSDAVKKEEEERPEEECVVKEEEQFEEVGDQDTTLTAEEDEKPPPNPTAAEVRTGPAVASVAPEEDSSTPLSSKKDPKKKKLGKKVGKTNPEKDKEPKLKAKKRLKQLEAGSGEWDKGKADLKTKSKKLKKSKNKKRFLRHEEGGGGERKAEFRDDDPEKLKRREKKRSEKKFLKGSPKGDEELTKKKKSKKSREKFVDKKDFFESSSSTKKTKKKRKSHLEENQDTDSDRESVCKVAAPDGKKRKRKKFKVKECSSSDEGEKPLFKEKGVSKEQLLLRQDSKSDDPDMSFLLCEEKVPASPAGGDLADDTSGSSSGDENNRTHRMDLLPGVYPGCSGGKHGIDTVLDNTPPTTPSSTESLLSSSPSHHGGDRDPFPPAGYPESTQSGGSERLFQCGAGRVMPARGSEEYRAATTLAFAVCKSVSDQSRPKESGTAPFGKRSKGADAAPCKRKKKRVQRYPETTKSPKHKSTYPRVAKVENYCEDSSGTSPATSSSPPYGSLSSPSFSRSLPNRLTEGAASRYSYVPLHEKDPEKRISVLQDKMAALRKRYMALRAEVIAIDHKRRKARKKVREAAGVCGNPSVQSEDGPSCS